ncbi:MAG: HEPN domain-containing protein [Parcubacteria group bacterium]|nr:HEPN domain-containing protein [Parcubacteria group bacterium]
MKAENKKIIAARWVRKARDDELNIRSILKHRDGAPSGVCFLSQQMAEKYLKGLN